MFGKEEQRRLERLGAGGMQRANYRIANPQASRQESKMQEPTENAGLGGAGSEPESRFTSGEEPRKGAAPQCRRGLELP